MQDDPTLALGQGEAVLGSVVIAVAVQHDPYPQRGHCPMLDRRGGRRHHDHGIDAQPLGCQSDALGMIAGRNRQHAARPLLGTQCQHPIGGTPQFERMDGLQILALEQHGCRQALGEPARRGQRRALDQVVDRCGQDGAQPVLTGDRRHPRTAGDGGHDGTRAGRRAR